MEAGWSLDHLQQRAGGGCVAPPRPCPFPKLEKKSLVSTGRAVQCFGIGQAGPAWPGHSRDLAPASPGAGRSQEGCHLPPLLYPEAGVYIVSECLPFPAGVRGLQYTQKVASHSMPVPQSRLGEGVAGWTRLVSQTTGR